MTYVAKLKWLWRGWSTIIKITDLSKSIYRSNKIPIKIAAKLGCERIAKWLSSLSLNILFNIIFAIFTDGGCLTLTNIRIYYKTTIPKIPLK